MNECVITGACLVEFAGQLNVEEKSPVTIEKYLRDAEAFRRFVGERQVSRELVIAYKQNLIEAGYAVSSINSMLASVNSLLAYLGLGECRVRSLKRQRQIYCAEEKELTKSDYMKLVQAAEGQPRLCMVMKTMCGTGIRISELKYFTVEAVQQGQVQIRCKGKNRMVLLPGKLQKQLLQYAKKQKIAAGPVFITRTGQPLNRSNVWKQMKQLCEKAGVRASKVFPHNLRKLFARTFYRMEKDIAKLADILGHSSIDTTRIYIMTTGWEHRQKIERLGLVV